MNIKVNTVHYFEQRNIAYDFEEFIIHCLSSIKYLRSITSRMIHTHIVV